LFKFFFVRNPYHRILSAYIDKVFVPNPLFWHRFGKPSIQMFRKNDSRECFHDPTFAEFVQFVTWSEKNKRMIDPHFLMSTEMCIPCIANYTFIGKMESFKDDALAIFEKFNLSSMSHSMERQMKSYADDDAIYDSIASPFSWKKDITPCMTWHEALLRIWRKLQLRGIIEMSIKLPVNENNADNVTQDDFIRLANEARSISDQQKLKQQKKEMFIKFYQSVPVKAVHALRKAFERDFFLFDYESTPNEIFNRSKDDINLKYANFNS